MRILTLVLLFLAPYFLYLIQVQSFFGVSNKPAKGHISCAPAAAANIIFQSNDQGMTWDDISAGLPEDLNAAKLLAGEQELLLNSETGIFRSNTHSKTPNWEKETSLRKAVINISSSKGGMYALTASDQFYQKMNGVGIWTPVFTEFKDHNVRSVFSASDGSIFIGSDNGIYKSGDHGKTWKHVMKDGWMIEMVESNGVLLCTNIKGILRSVDGGEHWETVISEGGVGIAVEVIDGGFAAITYNTFAETRRIRTSMDGGQTWKAIDENLPPSFLTSSIKQVGNSFFCGHPKGIYRSDDEGKTWELILPTIGEKVFNLSVSGDVLYAVLTNGGC